MSVRSRSIRRLMILLGVFLVLAGIAAGLYFRNEHLKSARLEAARQAGMTAFKAGDYRTALDALKNYVAKRRGDNEALFAYGVSRSKIEEPDGHNIAEGINVFTALLQQDPDNKLAKYDLLDLYLQASYNKEALDLADRLLSSNPADIRALKAKCTALDRQHNEKEALVVSQKLNELNPLDFDQQLQTYRIMLALKSPPQQMIERAQKQRRAHPDDPRFILLGALVHGWSGDISQARALLHEATTRPAPDAAYVRSIVGVLDSQKMYPDAQKVLNQAASENKQDPQILRILVQRLWQSGQAQKALDRLKGIDRVTGDTDLLAFAAMSLFDLHKPADAKAILATLAKRSSDTGAIAWSIALSTWFDGMDAKDALGKLRKALDRAPDNAVIRSLLGDSYARLGEKDLAVQAWRRAADLSPSWAAPRINAARTLATTGRIKEAVAEAQAAFIAAPDSPDAVITLACVQYDALEHGELDSGHESALLSLVQQIQEAMPDEPQTLPLYVNLLARAGRKSDAIAAARNAIASPTTRPSAPTLLRLLSTSRAQKLGLDDELQSALNAAGGEGRADPRVTLARAADLAVGGHPADGLALIDSRARVATTQPAQWALARVQYEEMAHDPSAPSDWARLGEAYPDNLDIQIAILKTAQSARADRDFMARTIDRVKALTGPDGQTWKLERARWLIGSDSSKDAAEAANTLTEITRNSPRLVEARLLLASAYEKVGNAAAATTEMEAAADEQPNNALLALEVARLMQSQNQFSAARQYLDRAAASPELTPQSRRRAATLFAEQGDIAQGIKLLQDAQSALDIPGKLLLAELDRRQNHPEAASAIYRNLLSLKPATLDVIQSAADFYASQSQLDEAKQVLARVSEATTRPAVAEMVRGAFEERHGTPAGARRSYAAATQASPTDSTTWRALVEFQLRAEHYDRALQIAAQAMRTLKEPDATLSGLHSIAGTLEELAHANGLPRAALSVLASAVPSDRGAADLLLNWQTHSATQPTTAPVDLLAGRLSSEIARFPRSLALRKALMQVDLSRKQYEEVTKLASETMDAFPTDAESCRIAATVYRAAGKHDLAMAAARRWRERTAADPLPADRAMAEMDLDAGDAAAALSTLQPYEKQTIADPDRNAAVLVTLLRAQAQSGHPDQAHEILHPLLNKGSKWRLVWLELAGDDIGDLQQARSWLNEVASLIPPDDITEQTALGTAWYQIGIRLRDPDADAQARKILDPIVKQPNAPASALVISAALSNQSGEIDRAESLYRRALALSPDQPKALNNLAYLLYLRGKDLPQARTFAARAVALSPQTASFYDTLARVQARLNQSDEAVKSFHQALRLEPDNVEAMIGLAITLRDSGRRDLATALLPRIENLVKTHTPLPTEVHQQLDELRTSMRASI
jgi:tetratricopeptide (TPR) repeat protein